MKISKKILIYLIIIAILMPLLTIRPIVHATSLSNLQNQANDLNDQIQSTQQYINSLQKQVSNAQNLLVSLNAQNKATQTLINLQTSKINLTQKQIKQTQAQIAQKTAELKIQKQNLFETMTVYYESTHDQSTLETIIGANSLSSAIDRTQYLESVGNNLNESITKINQIMTSLEKQNKNLETEKTNLEKAKNSLLDQQRNISILTTQKQAIMAQIANKKSASQSALNQLYAEKDNVSAQIYALRQSEGGYSIGGTGGYPWADASTDGVDPWGFYYRQCTSYAAWYFNIIEGKRFYSWRYGFGINRSSNGGDWPALARYQGYTVSSSPRAGAIASWPAGGINAYGHVAIVQSVNSNGTIDVSEYNWVPYSYDERHNVSPGGASFIY